MLAGLAFISLCEWAVICLRFGKLTRGYVDLFFLLFGFLIGGISIDAKDLPRYFKRKNINKEFTSWALTVSRCLAGKTNRQMLSKSTVVTWAALFRLMISSSRSLASPGRFPAGKTHFMAWCSKRNAGAVTLFLSSTRLWVGLRVAFPGESCASSKSLNPRVPAWGLCSTMWNLIRAPA